MTRRVMDPRQQGTRLAWSNGLFELVDSIPSPPHAAPELVPLPDVHDVTMRDWLDARFELELRDAVAAASEVTG